MCKKYWLTACSSLLRKKVWLCELTVPPWPKLLHQNKGSSTLAMGKCLWFSVKIKVCQSFLSSPWSFPDLCMWNPFSIFNASKCKILGWTISFTLKYIEIRKHIIPPPSVCQQKLLHVYVLPYFTHCMEVACWHKGGEDVQQPKNPGPKPIKCLFCQIRN